MARKERIEELKPMLERLTDPVFASVHTLITVLSEFSEKPMSLEEAEAVKAEKPVKAAKKPATKREVKDPPAAPPAEHTCTITLTAYPEKKQTICRVGDHFVSHVKIDNRQAILQSMYVKASPNNPLNVEYVELQGITTDTGVPVTEKVRK